MYKDFFSLTSYPFHNTPDPRFLFSSRSHKEALASMVYGVQEGKGFILVTGDVGSGKTLLAQALKKELGELHVLVEISNPWVTPEEVLAAIQSGVGLVNQSDIASLETLKKRLITLSDEGRRVVLMIDEAHQLPERTLEGICLLSNIETATQKLIQIVLLGQNELGTMLNSYNLRQLQQRITLRSCLQRLNNKETALYIQHRLRVAGGNLLLIPPECIDLIYQESLGIPRVINHVCDKCLLFAFGRNSKKVTPEITRDAINSQRPERSLPLFTDPVFTGPAEMDSEPPAPPAAVWAPPPPPPPPPPAPAPPPQTPAMPFSALFPQPAVANSAPGPQVFELPFAEPADKAPGHSPYSEQRVEPPRGSGFRSILLTLLIGAGVGALVLWYIQGENQARGGMFSSMQNPFKTEATKPKASQAAETPSRQGVNSQSLAMDDGKPKTVAPPMVPATEVQAPSSESAQQYSRPVAGAMPPSVVTTLQLPGGKNNPLKSREEKVGPKNLLSAVANRHYGAWNETVRDLIAAANPELDSLDNLPAGTKVQLPIFSRESLVVKDGQGRYYVYFGSFDKLEFARMNLDAIKRSFSGAELVPVNEQGVQLQRLFVGPFVSQGEAQAVANSLWFKYLPILN